MIRPIYDYIRSCNGDNYRSALVALKKLHLSAVGYFDIRFFEGCVITGKRSLIEKDEIKNLLKQNMTNQS